MTGIREWMRDCISHMTGIRERMRDCISVEIRTQFLVLLVVASLFTLSGECIVLYLVAPQYANLPKKKFNIKTFPQLGKCFDELEASQETDLAKKSPAKIKSADMDIDLLVTECKQRVKNLKQVSKNYQKEKEKLDHNVAEMEKLLGQIAKQQQKNKDPFPIGLLESHVKRIVEEMEKNKKTTTEDDVFNNVVYDEEE